jgi:hypothetical protein
VSLIFHKFESFELAEAFAADVRREFRREAEVYKTQDESNKADPFPFVLEPPIVLVERASDYSTGVEEIWANEREVITLAEKLDAEFAGT